jgi:hypothetical protein
MVVMQITQNPHIETELGVMTTESHLPIANLVQMNMTIALTQIELHPLVEQSFTIILLPPEVIGIVIAREVKIIEMRIIIAEWKTWIIQRERMMIIITLRGMFTTIIILE